MADDIYTGPGWYYPTEYAHKWTGDWKDSLVEVPR